MKNTIDLNCDMGEGFGVWEMGDDFALLKSRKGAAKAKGKKQAMPRKKGM